MILLTQTDKKVAVEYTNLLIFAVYLFWCIQDRGKSTSNDDETHCIIYKAIVNWITKVSEFKWHLYENVTKLIEMIIKTNWSGTHA